MLTLYAVQGDMLTSIPLEEAERFAGKLVWVDLLDPVREEEVAVERLLNTEVPSREEMSEIELSSRLYQEDGTLHATATLVTSADTSEPETHAVTFLLRGQCLITIRYANPRPFRMFISRANRLAPPGGYTGQSIFASLLELIVDRLADILEMVGHDIDGTTRKIFRTKVNKLSDNDEKPDFENLLQDIGLSGDLVSKTRESMVSINRLLSFVLPYFVHGSDEYNRIGTLLRDIAPLSDHASFLSNKVNFLLDATLGMISIEQNAIIKIFSVAAVVFLPPTLIASIYGMNFHFIPELDWRFGYPLAIVLMLLSGYLPYKYFKRRKWL